MEIPFFKRPEQPGEVITEQVTTRPTAETSQTSVLPDRPLPALGCGLPAEVQQAIQTALDARDSFFEFRNHHAALKDKVAELNTKARQHNTEAEEHNEAGRSLIRSEGDHQNEIRALAAQQQTALNLASQYRSYAEELLLDLEEAELNALEAAKKYYSAWESALSRYADFKLDSALNGIEDKLLFAIKLKAFSISPRRSSEILHGTAGGYQNAVEAALGMVHRNLKERLSQIPIDNGEDEAFSLLYVVPDLSPFNMSDIESVAKLVFRKKELERKRQATQAA